MGEKRKTGSRQADAIWAASVFALALVGVLSLLHPSKDPLLLYSAPTLVLHVVFIGTLALGVFACKRQHRGAQFFVLILMLILSAMLGARGALFDFHGLIPLLLIGRTAAFVALALIGLQAKRENRKLLPQAGLLLGATLALWTVLDWGLYAWTVVDPPQRFHPLQGTMPGHSTDVSFREPFDPGTVRETDILLIGDSFVWGVGVEPNETMGKRLDEKLPDHRVISLGSPGQSVARHIEVLSMIPGDRRVDRIVLVYYHNDMPEDNSMIAMLDDGEDLGRTSPGAILALHFMRKIERRGVEDYHDGLIADADPDGSDFDRRWNELSGQLETFAKLSRERSRHPPALVILPIMVDFEDYPLEHAHMRIGREGESLGYEVIDMLPVFRDQLGNGVDYRAAPNDSHCDARTHQFIADTLHQRLVD